MVDYDIGEAFRRIENELISSMIRNFKHHRAEETAEGIQWSQWQAEQLKALAEYKNRNKEKFSGEFSGINENISKAIRKAYDTGGMEQEIKILKAVEKGYTGYTRKFNGTTDVKGNFFKVNERKLNQLIKSTTNDMQKAENAVLRMANDKYRKIIFDAQVYANAGGTTYEKAVDMATHDFVAAGLNCIEYKNGARHTISDYADMAVRTANKRAYLRGEGTKRAEWGIHTVIVNKRGNACPLCLPFVGIVLIDDVYSGGSADDGNYTLLSSAMTKGFLHPRCKDSYTTYFEGISTPPKEQKLSKADVEDIKEKSKLEQKHSYAQKQAKRMERMSKFSLDKDNQRIYGARAKQWNDKANEIKGEIQRYKNSVAKSGGSGIIEESSNYHQFNSGEEANDFFYYDDDKRGLFAKKNSSHGKWLRSLSDDEKASVIDYAGGGYQDINNYWRKKGDWEQIDASRVEEESKQLDNAISRYELKDSIVVQRGAMENVLDQLFENYETPGDYSGWIGKKYVEQGYMSTTVLNNNSIATAKPVVFNIQVPAGQGVGAYINEPSLTGFCDTEYEFLIKRNSTFTITDVKENVETGEFIVDMRLDK